MKKLLLFLLLLPSLCFPQGAHRVSQVIVKGNGIAANVSPGSKILVCVVNTGCKTAANIYLDAALTTPAPNPVTADGSGNYDYYIASGCVDEQISSPGQGSIFVPNVCPFNGTSGGGATFPNTVAPVVSLTTTTSRAATPSDFATVLQTAGNCATSGTVYSPQSNTCVSAGAAPLGTQYKLAGYTGAGSGSNTALGQFNFTTDSTGNQLNGPITNNAYNAVPYQTSPGSNDGLANAEAAAGANGTTFAPSNYATTEAPGFAAAANTIVTDYRAGTRVFQHNQINLDEDNNFVGKRQDNCLLDGALSKSSYICSAQNAFFFGPGIDIGNGNVTSHQSSYNNFVSYTPGIQSPNSGSVNSYAVGDFNRYDYMNYVGGYLAGGDEGVQAMAHHTIEAVNMFTATVATGGAGATSITTTPTSAGSDFNAGGNGQYTGGMLLDLTQVADSGNVTSVATVGGIHVLDTDTSHTASTVYGTTTAAIPDPGNWPNGAAETFTLATPSTGSFAPGDEFCFGGPTEWEESSVTTVTGSAGAQTITANLTLPNGVGALVVKGKCQAITFDVDKVAGVMDPPYVILGAPSTTSYWAGYYTAEGRDAPILSGANSGAIVPQANAMSNISRTSNIVTAQLSPTDQVAAMNLASVAVTGCADSSYDGTVTPTIDPQDPTNGNDASITYTSTGANGTTTGCSVMLLGRSGFHLYPMAKVIDVADPAVVGTSAYYAHPTLAIDGWFQLGHNAVTWTASDSLEEPHPSSVMSGDDFALSTQNSPTPNTTASYGVSHSWTGRGQTGSYQPITFRSQLPPSEFAGLGGTLPPIATFQTFSAIAKNFFVLPFAPVNYGTVMDIGCPAAPGDSPFGFGSNCASPNWYSIVDAVGSGNSAFIQFQPSTTSLRISANTLYLPAPTIAGQLTAQEELTIGPVNANAGGLHFPNFETASSGVEAGYLQACQPFVNGASASISLCNGVTNQSRGDALGVNPQENLWLGYMRADTGLTAPSIDVGWNPPIGSVSVAHVGSGSGTQRVYAVAFVGPLGIPGTVALDASFIDTGATLSGSEYVNFTCPSAYQAGWPTGTYELYTWLNAGTNTTRDLGTCALGATVKDDGTVTTLLDGLGGPVNNANDEIRAGQVTVQAGGSIRFRTDLYDKTNDAGLSRSAAGVVSVDGATLGDSLGTVKAATGTFSASATVGGQNVCLADGTNCLAGGSGISGLTAGYLPLAGSPTTLTANSHMDDGLTTAGTITSTEPIAVNDGSGIGGTFSSTEGTAATGASGVDKLWADSTNHRFLVNNNNGGSAVLATLSDFASATKFGVVKVDGTTITASGGIISATGGGGSGISGLTAGYIPLAGSATTITGSAHMDDGVTTASTITATEPIVAPGFTGSGTTPSVMNLPAGTGSIPALPGNSAGLAAPATGGTSYLLKLPATITAGIVHLAAPATGDGVNESALTSSAVSLTADVSGVLPTANGGTGTASPGIVAGTNIAVTGIWPNQTVKVTGISHPIGWSFGDAATGSALTTSEVGYVTVPHDISSCTISGWHIMADAGTVTIKVARINGGTANPTLASNSISTSGVSLATGTKIDSTTVSDFTSTTLSANDTLGFFITAVSGTKQVTFQLDCTQP